MATSHQLAKNPRQDPPFRTRTRHLRGKPQRRGVVNRVLMMSPKKPNSANRRIAKVLFHNPRARITAHIPGVGHNLQKHSQVLVRGGRAKDLPGVKFRLIRGVKDLQPLVHRRQGRSKYGMKKF